MATLHERLVARQSTEELRRKAEKSRERANLWTQEEIDYAKRRGHELWKRLHRNCGKTCSLFDSGEPCQ